jgi:hypothetical protein
LNLPRLAILEKTNPGILDENLDILHKILVAHRRLITRRAEEGVLPLYTHNWMTLKRQYSTIGIIGAYEYIENKGLSITTREGIDALKKTLAHIEDFMSKWQKAEAEEGNVYSVKTNGKTITLHHNEKVAVQVKETGEVKEVSAKEVHENPNKYLIGLTDD